MIICPECKQLLKDNIEIKSCTNCSYNVRKENGIWLFMPEVKEEHQDYKASDLELLSCFEEKHFWFKRRRDFIKYFVNKYIPKNTNFLEIGAGTCFVAKEIKANGYDVAVGDLHKNGLEMAKKYNIDKLYQFDLFKFPFKEHFDSVGMFDVLEHLDDDNLALLNVFQILKPKGYLILTLPAHKWLWGNFDVAARHKKRYAQFDIIKLLQKNNFKIINVKNFFITLVPLILIRKSLQKNETSSSEIIDNNLKINPLINFILNVVTYLEFQILKYLPCKIGGSIIVIAQKEE